MDLDSRTLARELRLAFWRFSQARSSPRVPYFRPLLFLRAEACFACSRAALCFAACFNITGWFLCDWLCPALAGAPFSGVGAAREAAACFSAPFAAFFSFSFFFG